MSTGPIWPGSDESKAPAASSSEIEPVQPPPPKKEKYRKNRGYVPTTFKGKLQHPKIRQIMHLNDSPAAQSLKESILKAAKGEIEPRNVNQAYLDIQEQLVDTINKIGLDAASVAQMLKDAMKLAMTTGKTVYDPLDPEGKRMVAVPDLRALERLMFLWGQWMRVGRPNGTVSAGTINLFASGLNESERQRVGGLIELLEGEVKRRGLSDVRKGGAEAQDAAPLPGVVDAGEPDEAAPGSSPS